MEQEKRNNKEESFFERGLKSLSEIVSEKIFYPLNKKSEMIINNMEKRIVRKISSLMIIWIGGLFLVFSLFFFLRENLGWNNAESLFSIGIIIFVAGLIVKIMEPKNTITNK